MSNDVIPQAMKDAFPESDGWKHSGAVITRHRVVGGGILAKIAEIAAEVEAENAAKKEAADGSTEAAEQ